MPNRALELVSRTTTSITVRAINLPAGAAGVNWYLGTSTSSMPFVESWDGVTNGATASYTLYGLQPNTLYYVKFLPYDAYGGRLDPAHTDAFATQWQWDSDVTSGAEFGMTAAEFNRFIDLVFATATAKGISLSGSASSYYVTRGTDMLASQVNNVRSLISTLGASVPSAAVRGSSIKASFFNGLVSSLYTLI